MSFRDARANRSLAESMSLYAVTDSAWLGGRRLADLVAQAIAGGATFVQLREKYATHEERCVLAREVLAVCRSARVPFVVDDDVACALEVGADGVHVGQDDMACLEARRALGPEAIVGVSVHSPQEVLAAQADGADYLGVGAVFGTPTKPDADVLGLEGLRAVCAAASIPTVAIGGIGLENVASFADTGVDGIAVVSALFASDDPRGAAQALRAGVDGWARVRKGGC